MNRTNPKVDWYFHKAERWREELAKLRTIVLDCPLDEELKWGKPCYALQGSNVVLIVAFKEYCALLFPKGALLNDPLGILILPGANTQAARQIRFTGMDEITSIEVGLKDYISAAIEAEKSGLEVAYKTITEFALPEELEKKFEDDPALKTAFEALTPGRRRAYLMHFSAAKQSKTREARIEKCTPLILSGKGMNDEERLP